MKLYFCNDSEFPIAAMTTFGVNVKDDDSAIGYFGTGFKYAVAIILRLGGKITVKTNGEMFEFGIAYTDVRGKQFDIVTMNGSNLGFTTEVGKKWEPWMAYRELYCNAIDEHGFVSEQEETTKTVITVECAEIFNAHLSRAEFLILDRPLLSHTSMCSIHAGASSKAFYKGVAVHTLENPALFSYSLGACELTEDRTSKYPWAVNSGLVQMVQACSNKDILKEIFTANTKTFEGKLRFDDAYHTSDEFINMVCDYAERGINIRQEIVEMVRRKLRGKGTMNKPALLTIAESRMIERAIKFLKDQLGMNITDFDIKVVETLGAGVMGLADGETIFISKLAFNMGTKQVASTLMEEFVHNKTGASDFSREMQNWLFDKILSMGEDKCGEPL